MAETSQFPTAKPQDGSKAAKSHVPAATKKPRPTKVIPTERLTVKRQLDILRAFAAASGPSGKPVTNREVAEILKMADTTVSLANYFFIETGLVVKGANGFVPSSDVMNYSRANEWNPATAAHKLAPLLAKTWFAEALTPKLSFRPMDENEAIDTLADASAATKEYRPNLKMLIDFLESVGIVQRDGNMLKLLRLAGTAEDGVRVTDAVNAELQPSTPTRSSVSTSFAQPTEGVVQFHISVKVEMAEFANWQPDRIAAFFAGIAQVLAAKAAVETKTGTEK